MLYILNVVHTQGNMLYLFADDHDLLGRTYLMHAIHGECEEGTIEYILSLHFNINHQAHGMYHNKYHHICWSHWYSNLLINVYIQMEALLYMLFVNIKRHTQQLYFLKTRQVKH
jgi:hypothetical protein